jgi:hypothetical protein
MNWGLPKELSGSQSRAGNQEYDKTDDKYFHCLSVANRRNRQA